MAVTVTAFDGREWRVGRRWVPWRLRWRGRVDGAKDLADGAGCLADGLDGIVGAVLAAIALVLFVLFVLPVLIALVELTLLALLILAGVLVRIGLRRPWIVDANAVGSVGVPQSWKVVGWRRSNEVIQDIATQLQSSTNVIPPVDAEPC